MLPGYLNKPYPQCWHFPDMFTDYKSQTQFNPTSYSNYLHFGGAGGITIGMGNAVVLELVLLTTGVGVGIDWGTQVWLATTYIKLAGQQPPPLTIIFGCWH